MLIHVIRCCLIFVVRYMDIGFIAGSMNRKVLAQYMPPARKATLVL